MKQLGRGSLISPFPMSREAPSTYFLKFCHFLHKLCASLHALYFHSCACSHKLVVIRILKITKVGQGESPRDLQTYLLTFPSEYKTTMTFMSFSTLHLCVFFFLLVLFPHHLLLFPWIPSEVHFRNERISSLLVLIKIHVGFCLESEQPRRWTQLSMEIATAAQQPRCCLNQFLNF